MNIETKISPKDPSDQLRAAKEEARQVLLDDEATFAVLQEKLFDSNNGDDYPEFTVEPTLERNDSDESVLGFRITKSRTSSGDELEGGIALYEYLKVGKLDRGTGKFHESPELAGLMTSARLEEGTGMQVAQAWQKGFRVIGERMGDLAFIDPATHVIELKSDIEGRLYPSVD